MKGGLYVRIRSNPARVTIFLWDEVSLATVITTWYALRKQKEEKSSMTFLNLIICRLGFVNIIIRKKNKNYKLNQAS